jgi:hypothetical protein
LKEADMSKPDRLWIDCLSEKHECWSYDNPAVVEVPHNGRVLRVLMPDYLTDIRPRVTAESGELLFLLGKQSRSWEGKPLGVFVIARRQEGDTFAAVVWHELYPWALIRCGLEQPPPAA